jgi:serine/threonine-protein kinase
MGEASPGFQLKHADVVFGQVAVARHFCAPHHIRECTAELGRRQSKDPDLVLADLLVRRGYLTRSQRETIERIAVKQIGPEAIGRYELIAKIGEGGMGTVYKARDRSTGRVVALKVLPQNFAQDKVFMGRFQREALAVTRLEHKNIVRGIDVGAADGSQYIAMEFIEGVDCDKMLSRRGRIPEKEAVRIASQVARALSYAHSKRLVHRDIKPGNIIVASDGTAKLTDLGLAKSTSATAAKLTQTGITMGTPHYISPEQAMGSRDLDIRSDIYSLGATLYHLVAGRVPFEGSSPAVIVAKHLTEELENPKDIVPELSDGLVMILEKMLAKDRDDRYSDPDQLASDLEKVAEDKQPSLEGLAPGRSAIMKAAEFRKAAERVQERRRQRFSSRRIPAALIVGVMLGLGIAVGVVVLIVRSRPDVYEKIRNAAEAVAGKTGQENAPEGWASLFDGKGLAGWNMFGARGWRVADGVIHSPDPGSGRIETTQVFRDYRFCVEVAGAEGTEAWLVLRKPPLQPAGGCRVPLPASGRDKWVPVEVTATGPQVTVIIGGKFLRPATRRMAETGVMAFEVNSGELRLRGIRVQAFDEDAAK